MKKIADPHIRRWLLTYLVVVTVSTVAVSGFFFYQAGMLLTPEPAGAAIKSAPDGAAAHPLSNAPSNVKKMLFWLIGGQIAGVGGLGYAWYLATARKIERPALMILAAVNQLARGQLDETVAIERPAEFRQIGNAVNELAANLQELLLYIWKQTGQCLALIGHIQPLSARLHDPEAGEQNLRNLEALKGAIEDLRDMARSYVFYDVRIEGDKARAISHSSVALQPDEGLVRSTDTIMRGQ